MDKWVLRYLAVAVAVAGLISCTQPTPTPTPPVTAAPTQSATPKTEPTKGATAVPATPAPKTAAPSGPPYFQGKTIEITLATAAGGGTDATGRAVAAFIGKFIPGNPKVLVRNQPGAGGVVATNSFFEKAKPDGFTWLHGSASIISNQQRRRDIVNFDMRKMVSIGNIGEAGPVVGIRKDAMKRLTDQKTEPVVIGTRTGEETWNLLPLYAREFKGWNVRWLTGFGGTGEIDLAFRRGEVDMFGDSQNLKRLADEGLAEIIVQEGRFINGKFVRRPDFPNVPTFPEYMADKLPTGLAWDGYIATLAPATVFKWTVLPPGTPENIQKICADAYAKMAEDPAFNDMVRKVFAEVYNIDTGKDTDAAIRASLDVKPEAPDYVDGLLRKYGVMK